jgi:aerobic-type carbon monoxide dehydrogenase small subunit (CoxS/CutS family)
MAKIALLVDGRPVEAQEGDSVAAVLINSGVWGFRRSPGGEMRAPLCAMGICFECRVTIDGERHRRACLEACRAEMEVVTDD